MNRLYAYGAAFVFVAGLFGVQALRARESRDRAVEAAKVFVRDSINGAASLQLPAQVETVTVARLKVDTLIRKIVAKADTVTRLVARIPDTVLVRFPVVDTLVVESGKLASLVPLLRDSLSAERKATDAVRMAWGRVLVSVRDSLKVEQARPKRTFKGTLAQTGIGLAAGFVVGRWGHK